MSKHGKSNTKTYKIWKGMHSRCRLPKATNYKNYGGRGIKVCPEWSSFEVFYLDMGECPRSHSIDRKKNDEGYCKENCEWATRAKQNSNRRNNVFITHQGKTQTMAAWAKELGIDADLISERMRKMGWDAIKAITTPPRPMKPTGHWGPDHKSSLSNYTKAKRAERKAKGMCAECGKSPSRPNMASCAQCAERVKQKNLRSKSKK